MKLDLGNLLNKVFNTASSLTSSASNNLNSFFGKNQTTDSSKTGKTEQTGWFAWLGTLSATTPSFNDSTNSALRFQASNLNLSEADVQASLTREAARYNLTGTPPPQQDRSSGKTKTQPQQPVKIKSPNIEEPTARPSDELLYTPKAVILPLKDGRDQATHEELSRRVVQATLERNGIKPTNMELEAIMALPQNKNLDMHGWLDSNWEFHDKTGVMPSAGVHEDANGNQAFGYKMTLSPKFQAGIVSDYQQVQSELAATPEKKAVIDMSLNERMSEAIKIAYEKGYISQEVHKELSKLTPEQLLFAFGVGGAAGLATKTAARAPLGALGAGLAFKELLQNAAEFESFGHACAKATSRAELEKPARAFAEWMGKLSNDGVLAITAAGGAKIAPSVMPKVTADAEKFFKTTINGVQEAMQRTGSIGEPILATPNGRATSLNEIPNPKSPLGNNKGDNIFEARMKPKEVLLSSELEKLKDVAGYREQQGLPEYKYREKTGTVAETQTAKGEKVQGHSTKIERKYLGTDNAELRQKTFAGLQKLGFFKNVDYNHKSVKFLKHAEAEALILAAEKSGGKLPEKMTMTVDRTTCPPCQDNLPALLKLFGVKELTVINATGRRWLITPEKTVEITRQK